MNLTDLSLTDLTKLRREVLAAIKALRPKSPKPKPRKVRSQSERDRADAYVRFREEQTACWNCGRSENDRPDNWHGVYIIERAHITKDGMGRRIEDVRLINALCSWCHNLHTMGRMTTERMLELKREHDPDNYDPEFLQKHSVRRLEFPK